LIPFGVIVLAESAELSRDANKDLTAGTNQREGNVGGGGSNWWKDWFL